MYFSPLAKSFLLPFRLSVPMSATDAAFQKKMFGSSRSSDLVFYTTIK